MKKQSHIGVFTYLILGALSLKVPIALGDLMDAEKAEELARKTFTERYLEFTGDKNVMGKAQSVDGKVQLSGNKSRFNGDDGVSFKSDLTYHDLAYTSDDEANNNPQGAKDKQKSARRLQPFVSPHGGLSESGGSSILERTMYQEFDKYSKQEEKEKPDSKKEEQTGIKYRGVYKITTKEIFEDPKSKAAQAQGAALCPEIRHAGGGSHFPIH